MSELFPTRNIILEYVGCTDPNREYEFNHWYNKIHIPKLKQIRGVADIYRYRNLAQELREGQARYLTIYRIVANDSVSVALNIQKTQQQMKESGHLIDCCQIYLITTWEFLTFRHTVLPIQIRKYLPDGMPEAMLVVPSICTELKREEEFNEWYLYTHHHDLLETPGLVQTHRYVNMNPRSTPEEGKYLALYEIDAESPGEVVRKIFEDDRNIRIPQGRMINCIKATYGFGTYQHIDI